MTTRVDNAQAPPWWRVALIGRKPERTLMRIVILVITCCIVFKFVLLPIRIQGPSMLPTLRPNQVHVLNRLAYCLHPPRRGDVVAIRLAGEHVLLLKRIVGLPGETVAFHHGRLLINGAVIAEPYMKYPCDWDMAPVAVGPSHYYVVGDNRTMAWQDHDQGQPPLERIVGKLLL